MANNATVACRDRTRCVKRFRSRPHLHDAIDECGCVCSDYAAVEASVYHETSRGDDRRQNESTARGRHAAPLAQARLTHGGACSSSPDARRCLLKLAWHPAPLAQTRLSLTPGAAWSSSPDARRRLLKLFWRVQLAQTWILFVCFGEMEVKSRLYQYYIPNRFWPYAKNKWNLAAVYQELDSISFCMYTG